MPLYHFHVNTCVMARDEEGVEFPDLESAQAYAVENARYLAAEEMRCHNRFIANHSIVIADATGKVLHTTRYGDCVDVRL